ncbi:class I adenylate-forming enzyme family protein [Streptomyces cylindrosporus]|uniref:Fatty acid--CoA ligase family protein n=1 Tax=Streptomyces cylindrosporus TaxID=2927583 RepID=A0ABS9YAP9_9ACTN|nr:fatty acid--CoA ligase family protein [Streptomyces cylindrosporus]MCI3274314.1 fatty acid--CoA ligase family protein [Streptomyces cylindrosporus]
MNIATLLDMAAAGDPDRVAIGPRASGTTCALLRRTAAGVAAVVHASGARELVFAGLNGPAFPVMLFGAALAGVPLVPVNYRLSAEALAALLAHTEKPLVVADQAFADGFEGFDVRTPEALLAEAGSVEPASGLEASPDDPAVLLFTSGTTAAPKAAVLRHRHLASYILQTVEFASADPADAVLTSVPPYHVAGVGSVLSNVYAGRRMVHLGAFTPEAWLELVRAEEVTSAMVVPTMLARIVEHLDGRPAEVPTLRALAYGGARMPRTVLEAALRAFPDTGFTNAYGLTETSSTIALLGPEDHRAALASEDPEVRARLGSAGRMVPGVEAEIRNAHAPGAPGELWVRGPQVSGEYKGAATLLDADGWFHTRDLAHFDSEGYLFIAGRADDTIIRGGENIAPAEVEDVLLRHAAVREAAVVGVPDEEWGERIAAFVVTHEGSAVDAESLRGWVRGHLRGSRTPDVVVFRDELPYTPTGKLLRRELLTTIRKG